jgi:CheY-like chemotaxis protein
MGDDHERALAAGFDGYLEKPISLGLLRAEVNGFIGSAEGRRV